MFRFHVVYTFVWTPIAFCSNYLATSDWYVVHQSSWYVLHRSTVSIYKAERKLSLSATFFLAGLRL